MLLARLCTPPGQFLHWPMVFITRGTFLGVSIYDMHGCHYSTVCSISLHLAFITSYFLFTLLGFRILSSCPNSPK
ncbi:hypothetical protein EV424DRAFT_1439614 [Suillus variegatus]|nr:hypothetical protein EV424DRAFT_1439614 [Suillus variegatus]